MEETDPLGELATREAFFPRKDSGPDASELLPRVARLPIPIGARSRVLQSYHLERWPRADTSSAGPLLLFFHGNGELAGSYARKHDMPIPAFGEILRCVSAAHGGEVLLCEYAEYGTSEGKISVRALLEDAVEMYRFARHQLCSGDEHRRIVAMGRSIGSIACLEIARKYPDELACVIVESGMDDPVAVLADKLGHDAEGWRERIDAFEAQQQVSTPTRKATALTKATPEVGEDSPRILDHLATLAKFGGSVWIVHCVDDEVHSIEMARRMFAAAEGTRDPNFVELETGGHDYIHPMNWCRLASVLSSAMAGPNRWDSAVDRMGSIGDGMFWRGDIESSLKALVPKDAHRCRLQ